MQTRRAGRERRDGRRGRPAVANSQNDYRERSLVTCVGTLVPRIPKLRSGSPFSEDVLGRNQRVGRALVAAAAKMHATGTSIRKSQGEVDWLH